MALPVLLPPGFPLLKAVFPVPVVEYVDELVDELRNIT